MVDNKLANDVVRSLSEYLTHKKSSSIFEDRLEVLLNDVEAKLLHSYGPELVARFREKPGDNVEVNTLRLHLTRAIADDPEFARKLAKTFGGKMPSRRKWRVSAAAVVAIAVLGSVYLLGRTTTTGADPEAAPTTVTSTVEHTVTERSTTTPTTTASTSSAMSSSSSGVGYPGIPGDGSTVPEGQPVPLVDLPRPNDKLLFNGGDHDVQFEQYPRSLWYTLHSCKSRRYSREQQFQLKNYRRLEIKAVGTDSKADPELTVQFDVFANNDKITPMVTAVVNNPGDAKPLAVDLPSDVFALTLRISLTRTGPPCQSGNAVWGEPYVIAAGN